MYPIDRRKLAQHVIDEATDHDFVCVLTVARLVQHRFDSLEIWT
jgi:hypothetical protein